MEQARNDAFLDGFIKGILSSAIVWLICKIIWDCRCINYNGTRIFRVGSSSCVIGGNIMRGSSIVQSNGSVIIDGVDVTGADYSSPPISRAFRITADGEAIARQLDPEKPIAIRVAPDTVFSNLTVGGSLVVERGGLQVTGNISVGDEMVSHGPVTAQNIDIGDDLVCEGNVTASGDINVGDNLTCDGNMIVNRDVTAGDDITVKGDAQWKNADAGDKIYSNGTRKRRSSNVRR